MTTASQWDVLYTGRVQGVGFRYTAARIAARHSVRGFVRNLPDGCVQLVAEGAEKEVANFLEEVRAALGSKIRSEQTTRQPATGEFVGFAIRHQA